VALRRSLIRRAACPLAVAVLVAAGLATASPFGLNVHLGPPDALDRVAGDGIEWVRIDFIWALVAPTPDELDWRLYDDVVERLRQRGFRIYATIAGTPEWATDGQPVIGVPRDPDVFAEFCYRAAARYRGRVDAWGFWNEPNLERFWQGSRREYIDGILRPGLAAVALADPDALRVGPDLAHLSNGHWDDWLGEVIAAASDGLDVVAHHVYPSGVSAGDVIDKLDRDPDWPWEDDAVRRVLQRSGWWGRPLWLTETGLPSGDGGETIQALFYTSLVDRLFRPGTGLGWVDKVFFYELADSGEPGLTWGILGPPPGFGPKEAALAYRNAVAVAEVDDGERVSGDRVLYARYVSRVGARVVLRNTGTTSWSADGGYRLAPLRVPIGWSVQDVPLPAGRLIRPSATVALEIPLVTGGGTGVLASEMLLFRMVGPDGRPFGDPVRLDVWLSRDPTPAILRQPGNVQAAVGGTAELSVEVDGGGAAALGYRWSRNGIPLDDSDTIVGARTARLQLYDVTPADTGEYRCEVTASVRVLSEPGRLEVLGVDRDPTAPRRVSGRRAPDPKILEQWLQLRRAPRQ